MDATHAKPTAPRARRRRSRLPGAALLVVLVACGDDPTDPVHFVSHVEVVAGDRQTGVSGQPLAQPILARAVRDDGLHPVGVLHARIASGNGGIEIAGARAVGNGGGVSSLNGAITLTWTLGPASESQVLELFAVGRDTVRAFVTATVTAGSH